MVSLKPIWPYLLSIPILNISSSKESPLPNDGPLLYPTFLLIDSLDSFSFFTRLKINTIIALLSSTLTNVTV
uniref:Uncharacterized protein n=1 Tax=Rhizophagus irregularis (strain DAOM 181602 / DAOM 197198 / MUCL 43194) TaxID=747089 RepID=U9SMT8_RHIID